VSWIEKFEEKNSHHVCHLKNWPQLPLLATIIKDPIEIDEKEN